MEQIKKKLGRPAGSKNKPKKVVLTKVQVDLAKKLGISLEDYAKEIASMGKKKSVPVNFNWERLAKDLDKALKAEIAENDQHHQWCLDWRKKYDELEKKLKDAQEERNKMANVFYVKEIKLRGIIDYLEDKISGHDSV